MSVIIGNKYKILNEIGEGAFGKVFKAEHILSKVNVAIKIERSKESRILKYEARIYSIINSIKNTPKIRFFGTEDSYSYLVMDLYGDSIDKITMSDKNKIEIFIKCINILKDLHEIGIIHRDIKPENILFTNREYDEVILIDFGLAKYYINSQREHIPEKTGKKLIGTINYASINVHNGIEYSRRDDIESLCYTFIKVFLGSLPWVDDNNMTKNDYMEYVYKCKNEIYNKEYNIPYEILMTLKYISSLKYDSVPNYEYITGIFKNWITII